jgi:hypothetical protein
MPILLEMIQSKDSKLNGLKRVAIDAIYSLSVHCQEKIGKHREQIMKLLDICRTDKAKPVREAAMETLKMMKELVEAPIENRNEFDLSFEKSQ